MSFKNIKTAEDLLAEAKEAKRQEINSIRDQKETEGFMFNKTRFDSDTRSADRIAVASQAATSAILASDTTFEVTWTAADNSEHVLDAQGVLNMNAALAQHGLTLHETAKQYKQQAEAATTHEELKAIVWE